MQPESLNPWLLCMIPASMLYEGCLLGSLMRQLLQGVGELLGQPQQRRRLAASTAQPGRVNGTQFDLSSIDAGLGANTAAACTPSVACNASWALPAAAVVDIYAINARGGAPVSMGICTGARPGTPSAW